MKLHKKFIIVEGIDGAGKGVVTNTIANFLSKKSKGLLDLRKKDADLRKKSEDFFRKYKIILTCEPTCHGTGKDLRNKILKNLTRYTARQVAKKFADDRDALYKKVLIPALKKGLIVVQDRSVVSSFVYQINQAIKNKEKLTIEDIKRMNKIALSNFPGLIIVQNVDPQIAYLRLHKRKGKQDETDFEKIDALRKNSLGYKNREWREIFEKKGTEIRDLDCNLGVNNVKRNVIAMLKKYLNKNKIND